MPIPFIKMADSWKKLSNVVSFTAIVSEETLKSQHENILGEIESSSDPLGPTVRAIYDGNEHEKFLDQLDARIRSHDKDIERMCNFHYHGFTDSIAELLKVRGECEKLKKHVLTANRELQDSGRDLVVKATELEQHRIIQRNIVAAVEHLQLCLPVLEMYTKLNEQMKNERYYPALKTLEQLEHTYLPRVKEYRFSQIMRENIPKLRENIKEASKSEFVDFLENIRKHSDRIGQVAMQQAQKQRNVEENLLKEGVRASTGTDRGSPISPPESESHDSTNPFDEDADELLDEDDDEEISAQDMVDFAPVYRCLHIYSVLGSREQFETYYRSQRKKQARLASQPPNNMYESLNGYVKYFHQILGFFVVEDHILSTTQGLVTREYLNELWEMALHKIVAILRTHSAYCTDATLLLQIKNQIVLFSHTITTYGFHASKLLELLVELKDQYNEILMKQWVQVFRDIFDEDNYTSMYVETDEEYCRVTDQFPYHDGELEKQSYPKRLPFSEFVPRTYHQIKEFIYACLKFSEDLNLSHTEVDDMVRKSANLLLSRTLSGCLSALIKKAHLGLAELIQITINTTHLEKSCVFLEEFISNITGAPADSKHATSLQGVTIFKDARNEAEQQIYRSLNAKMDDFLDLASYNWKLEESKGHSSGYLMDLIAFLESNFIAFNHLPGFTELDFSGKVAQTACMAACKHLAHSLMQFLMDPEVKFVSMGALQQFNLDVIQCEQFANSDPVPGFRDGALQMTFLELRQLLDLFMTWDWSSYFADHGQPNSKYLRVSPQRALTLLEKMKDADKKKNLLSTFKKNERDKKKLMDTVHKQLRALAYGTS
ncbi:exocyst complex component 6B-like isoform X2 [Ptychodera flava]|uniref:exocyst complex component 6B-like isoform X2 n=1 Tax=Ptychodera flava TaxID=63121 RepID=UPI00396A2930